jgi:hypothetical protein
MDRLPPTRKLLLRIRNPKGVFEDHLSIRSTSYSPVACDDMVVGLFAERIFYKGSVVTLYVGQPVWASSIEGGNIPGYDYVRDSIVRDGFGFPPATFIAAMRDLRGRVFVVSPGPQIPAVVQVPKIGPGAAAQQMGKGSTVEKGKCDPLLLGAHFMQIETTKWPANVVLLEDGSVVALKQIDVGVEIVARVRDLHSKEELMAAAGNKLPSGVKDEEEEEEEEEEISVAGQSDNDGVMTKHANKRGTPVARG